MARYPRTFNSGHQSDLLYNDEMHEIIESVRHIAEDPAPDGKKPKGKLSGSLYVNRQTNELESYHKDTDEWRPLFQEKFQIIDGITNSFPSDNPVKGQLWIYNDVLCYWNGDSWKPIKALTQDASQFDLSLFENFLLLPSLNPQGNTVLPEMDIEEWRRKYLLNKIDPAAGAEFQGDGFKWKLYDEVNYDDNVLPPEYIDGMSQYLLPNLDVDRIYANGKLDYDYEKINSVTVQYPKNYVKEKHLSCIHVNPNKLTKITKRLFKIDRVNPRISFTAANTEFYGFQVGNILGTLLLPEEAPDDGGYFVDREDGIILSYNQSQNYDYVLAVHYEFTITKSTGSLTHVDSRDPRRTYFIQNFIGPGSLFVDGFEVGNDSYSENNMNKTITVYEDMNGREVEVLHTLRREFGFVRQVSLKNRAIIETVQDFRRPLVFMNGEAMNISLGDVIVYNRDGLDIPEDVASRRLGRFEVLNGMMNMTWTVIELCDRAADGDGEEDVHHDYDMFESEGIVPDADENGNVLIHFTTDDFSITTNEKGDQYADHIVLFVDGLLINRNDIHLDLEAKTISVPGLKPGQDYILLKDKYNYFADQNEVLPAIEVNRLTDSMVYFNGSLLCENRQFINSVVPATNGANGQVQLIPEHGLACCFDALKNEWITDRQMYLDIMTFADSYKNSTRAIQYNIPIKDSDVLQVYAYRCANDYSNLISIENYLTPIIPAFVGDKDKGEAATEIVIQGDYANEKVVVQINNESAYIKSMEKVEDEDGVKTKIVFTEPQMGMARITVFPQKVPMRVNTTYPFECYEVYLNGVRQYGYRQKLDNEDTTQHDGDAKEIAPNGYHYFEDDILNLVRSDERLTRQEAINILALEPKYRDPVADKSSIRASYTIETNENGTFFVFNAPICGQVTYVLHPPEEGNATIGRQYFLDHRNIVHGASNVYQLDEGESFYPGRNVVYVNGVRQPQDSYTVLNSRTIMFLDKETRLIGNDTNFRKETTKNADGTEYTENIEYMMSDTNEMVRFPHKKSDSIMVEVREDYGWKEAHFKLKATPDCFKIVLEDYGLEGSLLESTDEIKIYVDGAFFGLKKDVGYRAVINVAHPVLEIIDPDVIEMLTSDPMYNFYQTYPEAKLIYRNTHNGQDYVPPAKDIILEWR